MLCEMGADKNACDANGLTAFHIALMQASRDGKYAKNKLPFIYDLLVPDSISIQIDNKLIKIDNHRPLFFIINMMMSIFYNVKPTRLDINVWDIRFTYDYFCALSGISIQGYLDAVKHIPVNILPEHRKNRQHITAALSGNEIDKENGKKLFMRIKRGEYLFNHKAIVKHADESLDIYTKLGSPILGNILDSKINNPKYEEAILEKFTKQNEDDEINGKKTWFGARREGREIMRAKRQAALERLALALSAGCTDLLLKAGQNRRNTIHIIGLGVGGGRPL
jgi:hypothetical protein